MHDELVELLKRSRIEQQRHALAGSEFPVVVLAVDARLAATELTLLLAALELFEVLFVRHGR
ncbi:hypothetical protein D3C83_140900 [compost metagenome]